MWLFRIWLSPWDHMWEKQTVWGSFTCSVILSFLPGLFYNAVCDAKATFKLLATEVLGISRSYFFDNLMKTVALFPQKIQYTYIWLSISTLSYISWLWWETSIDPSLSNIAKEVPFGSFIIACHSCTCLVKCLFQTSGSLSASVTIPHSKKTLILFCNRQHVVRRK